MRMKADDWDAVIRTNLTGAHLCIQQALATMMRARAGRIINIASIVAQMGNAGQGQLRGRKGWPDWADESHRHRDRFAQCHRECRRAGFIETPMTDVLTNEVKDQLKTRISAGANGFRAGCGRRDCLSGQRRSRLHHRPCLRRERRDVFA